MWTLKHPNTLYNGLPNNSHSNIHYHLFPFFRPLVLLPLSLLVIINISINYLQFISNLLDNLWFLRQWRSIRFPVNGSDPDPVSIPTTQVVCVDMGTAGLQGESENHSLGLTLQIQLHVIVRDDNGEWK